MAQIGVVTQIDQANHIAHVMITRSEACGNCGACSNGLEQKDLALDAINECNAKVGDLVSIDIKEDIFLQAVVILYTLPLIGMLLGGGLGWLFGQMTRSSITEVYAFIFGIFGMALTFILIRLNKNKFETKKYKPIVSDVISEMPSSCGV